MTIKAKRIYLVGFMGCGKSTLGKALALSLGWQFCDLDTLFEERNKSSIPDYFKNVGEDGFRMAEKETLDHSFGIENVVFATGGGAPCFFDNMGKMNENGITIYLKLPPIALAKRLLNGRQGRPIVADKTDNELLAFITTKLDEREPYYMQSKLVVEDNGDLSVNGYVQLIRSANELRNE